MAKTDEFSWISSNAKIIFYDSQFMYDDINIRTKYIVRDIMRKTSIKNGRIGIFLDRDEWIIISPLAVLELGLTYVPIDIEMPNHKINMIIEDCKFDAVITKSKYTGKFIDIPLVLVDGFSNESMEFNKSPFNYETAYILYTSGTTGVPKGVEVCRESLINLIEGVSEVISFQQNDRVLCITSISFDIFFIESIMALQKGLTVILTNSSDQNNPKSIFNLIQNFKIDILQMTPSSMQILINYDNELAALDCLKNILIGGEPFPIKMLELVQRKTSSKIYNMYGPTETTVWSTIADLTLSNKIHIGKPIKNTEILILVENEKVVNDNSLGEICISGAGLAKGYLNKDELTRKSFVNLPEINNLRVYKTGDIGKIIEDGNIEYIGRKDHQIKIRGHRVELEEIEYYITKFQKVNQAVVLYVDEQLIAFYTCVQGIDKKVLVDSLEKQIPKYMIPNKYIQISEFPYTISGKIDRKKTRELLNISSIVSTNIVDIANTDNMVFTDGNELDIIIKIIEQNVKTFESDKILPETRISDLGLDSISFIKVIVALEEAFGFEFDDEKLSYNAFETIQNIFDYVYLKSR